MLQLSTNDNKQYQQPYSFNTSNNNTMNQQKARTKANYNFQQNYYNQIIKSQDQINKKRQIMLNKAEKMVENLPYDYFGFGIQKQFGRSRHSYCYQILKFLLFGYEELRKQVSIKKVLRQQHLITAKIEYFLRSAPNIQTCLQLLKQKVTQIEQNIFIYHNTAGNEQFQSKKYQFQIFHLLTNLADFENEKFRQNIIVGAYDPEMIAIMAEIDMLNENKRLFIQTKNQNYLSYEDKWKRIAQRQLQYQFQIMEKSKRKIKQTLDIANHKDLSYYLSDKFIEKLQLELMQIPNKSIRKRTLQNLKKSFSK